MKHLLLTAALTAAALIASAQTTQRLTATKANDYGIIYTLPNTALDITIEAEITTRQPGEFAKYAAKYLNATDPIMVPSTTATVKSVTINTIGVPNPDKRYLVTIKSPNGPFLLLSEDNIPLAMNTDRILATAEYVTVSPQTASLTPLQSPAAAQVITQEMLQSHSSAKKAELAAEQIYALRQSRTDIITGQADQMPPDGAAMQLVLDNIDAQEQALMAMFIGTTSTRTDVSTIQIVPEADITNQIIARLSPTDGILPPSDLSGTPIYLNLKVTEQGKLPVNEKGDQLTFPKGGVPYNIPGKAQVTVNYDGKQLIDKTLSIGQFGVVYGIDPANFTDKKAPIYIIFDPATGAAADIGTRTN